jgi:hypothetical protein
MRVVVDPRSGVGPSAMDSPLATLPLIALLQPRLEQIERLKYDRRGQARQRARSEVVSRPEVLVGRNSDRQCRSRHGRGRGHPAEESNPAIQAVEG